VTAPPADDGMRASSRHGAPAAPLLGEQDLLPAALRLCLTDGHLPDVTVDEQPCPYHVSVVTVVARGLRPVVAALVAEHDERLLRIRDRVLRDAAACGGCRDSAFRHSLSCDVLHIAQPDPRRRSS
jgi:hypothetical protein